MRYYESGEYERDVTAVAERAKKFIRQRARTGQTNLVIVLDVDDTALSDWNYMRSIDFGFEQGHFENWVARAEAPPIQPILELCRESERLGVEVFFVTGRDEHLREPTERNLRLVGFTKFAGLFMRPASGSGTSTAAFKASIRHQLTASGKFVIANIGDQQSDLDGGFAERVFKIPNPFY